MSMFKIMGDLFGGYVVHISGGVLAVILASDAWATLNAGLAPVVEVLK